MAPPAAAAAALQWLPNAAAFARSLEPYKRIGAVLIREDCMSVAVSNPYLNLSERAGGVMLRQGRVPARALQLLVTKAAPPADLAGWVIGCERGTPEPGAMTPERAATLRELVAALQGVAPGLPLCWHARAPGEGASCRLPPPSGSGSSSSSSGGGGVPLAECNAGGEFLQSFLDGLGALNTFG